MALNPKIAAEVQALEADSVVSLYILDTTPIGGTDIFRFTGMPDGAAPVVFDGLTYTPIDIAATGFGWDGSGSFARPRLQVANIGGLLTAAIIGLGDLVGSKFYRIRTLARHLDNGSDPDPTATFPMETYTVDQRTKQTKVFVEWQLCSILDQLGVMIPKRQCLRDSCTHTYRISNPAGTAFDYTNATCPFAGVAMFKEDGTTTTNRLLDNCGRKVSDCIDRFGATAVLPTRSFPGIARARL